MILHDEARWIFDESPHTGYQKTAHCFPVRDTHRMLCKPGGSIESVLNADVPAKAWPTYLLRVGSTCCVQAERGGEKLGHIELVSIRTWYFMLKRVSINHVMDAKACGYDCIGDLLLMWAYHNDYDFYTTEILPYVSNESKSPEVWDALQERPAELYMAWLVNFRVVEP